MQFYCHSMEPFTIYLFVRYNGQGFVHLSNMREDKWTEHLQDAGSTELAFKAIVDLPLPPPPSPNSWEDVVGPSTALRRPEWPLPKPTAAPVTDHPCLLLYHPGPWSTVLSLRTFLILEQRSVYCWHHISLHSVAKETRSPGTEKPSLKSGNPGSQSSTRGPQGGHGQEYNICILSPSLEGLMVFCTGWQLREVPKGGHPCAGVHTSGQMWLWTGPL